MILIDGDGVIVVHFAWSPGPAANWELIASDEGQSGELVTLPYETGEKMPDPLTQPFTQYTSW